MLRPLRIQFIAVSYGSSSAQDTEQKYKVLATGEVPENGDVVDLRDIVGHNYRLIYKGKQLLNEKLSYYDISYPLKEGEDSIKIACAFRTDGPHIYTYVSNVCASLGGEGSTIKFKKDWLVRPDRSIEEVCNLLELKGGSTPGGPGGPKIQEFDNMEFKINLTLAYTPEGYRLDPYSVTSRNIYILEYKPYTSLKGVSGSEKRLIKAGLYVNRPCVTSNVTCSYDAVLVPEEELKMNQYYLLCINNFDHLSSPQEHMKIMNPHPGPCVDTAKVMESFYREDLMDGYVYVFRFG